MHIRPTDLPSPSLESPFAHDTFRRKPTADFLTELLSTISGQCVFAIDAPWGSGKTRFITMWKAMLDSAGFPTLYFSAWENDFTGDPLVSLIGEMSGKIKLSELGQRESSKIDRLLEKGTKLVGTFAQKALPIGFKILTRGAIGVNDLIGERLEELAETLVKERIDKYEADKKTITDFKDALSQFAKEWAEYRHTDKPIVFFIDELDRCRPTYAIDLLEKLKHLFSVPGLVFVLAIDRVQLGHSICTIYGRDMDIDGYLRRFIDLDYRLEQPTRKDFCASLFERFGLSDLVSKQTKRGKTFQKFLIAFSQLADILELTPRVIEQSFSKANIVLRTMPTNPAVFPEVVALLIAYRSYNPKLYDEFVRKELSLDAFFQPLKKSRSGTDLYNDYMGIELEALVAIRDSDLRDVSEILARYPYQVLPRDQFHDRNSRIHETIRDLSRSNGFKIFDQLVRAIEMSERFQDQTLESKPPS